MVLPSSAIVPRLSPGDAEDRLHDLAAPGADQPVEAEDLALAQLEGDVVEFGRMRQAGDASSTGAPMCGLALGEDVVDGAADHHLDDLRSGWRRPIIPSPTISPSRNTV